MKPNFTEELHRKRKSEYSGPFCCFDMDSMLDKNDQPLYDIEYDPKIRAYYLKSVEGYIRTINYCPWCGIQLPKNLTDEWWKKRGL